MPWSQSDSYLQLFNMQPFTNISSITPPNIMIIVHPRQYFSKKILLQQNVYIHQGLRKISSAILLCHAVSPPLGSPTLVIDRESLHSIRFNSDLLVCYSVTKKFMQINPLRSGVSPLMFPDISRTCLKLTAACITLSHSSPHDLLYFATVTGSTIVISTGNPPLDDHCH